MSRISDALKGIQPQADDNNKTVTVDVSQMFDVATKILDQIDKIYPTQCSNDNALVSYAKAKDNCKSNRLATPEYKNVGQQDKQQEMVNHPSHYQGNKFEVIDIIEDYNLGFNLGNAIKYILRAGKKNDYVEDLKKAIWYLQREISKTR